MRYQRLLEQVAKENNTTPEKIENEMRKALQIAGYDIEPAIFIALAASKVKKTIYRNQYNIQSILFQQNQYHNFVGSDTDDYC